MVAQEAQLPNINVQTTKRTHTVVSNIEIYLLAQRVQNLETGPKFSKTGPKLSVKNLQKLKNMFGQI